MKNAPTGRNSKNCFMRAVAVILQPGGQIDGMIGDINSITRTGGTQSVPAVGARRVCTRVGVSGPSAGVEEGP